MKLKYTLCEMKNPQYGLSTRSDTSKENINKFEDLGIEILQTGTWRVKGQGEKLVSQFENCQQSKFVM